MTYRIPFSVHWDDGFEMWLVREASNAYSFSRVPVRRSKNGQTNPVTYYFETRKEADEQVRRLNKWLDKGGTLEYQHMETPAMFERVADTKYGCAW